eukprot:TRINITY_DN650_c0_g1_i4.p1 TRINITY_DN650_c0_g1~~TRINITY_DN650_c0_g1_i4.p1  ORF type:complete len:210 (-),score=36.80 TRINITY_DN650_c0_g1_i4:197-826(-)
MGNLSTKTEDAFKSFQKMWSDLEPDGVMGPLTRESLKRPRCAVGYQTKDDVKALKGDYTFYLDYHPSKLDKDALSAELQQAFDAWKPVTGWKVSSTDDKKTADIEISWSFEWLSGKGELFPFDAEGLTLAKGNFGRYFLDIHEDWYLQGDEAQDGFGVLPVAIHEIGHVIGLGHKSSGVMAPFYNKDLHRLEGQEFQDSSRHLKQSNEY